MSRDSRIAGGKLVRKRTRANILDVLIVGGGPAALATAREVRESGLSVLIVAENGLADIWKDYSSVDLDQTSLFDSHQSDPAAAAALLLKKWAVPFEPGWELVSLQNQFNGPLAVRLRNSQTGERRELESTHAVLVPEKQVGVRFSIAGRQDLVARSLDRLQADMNQPICVVGEGLEMAKSTATLLKEHKAKLVHWCYQGPKPPYFPESTREVLLEALQSARLFLVRGEPLTVIGNEQAYLAIRLNRDAREGFFESRQMEWPVHQCLLRDTRAAGISHLEGLGISTAKTDVGQRPMLNPKLETSLPNVFLIGPILAPRYVETEGFPSTGMRDMVDHGGEIDVCVADAHNVAKTIKARIKRPMQPKPPLVRPERKERVAKPALRLKPPNKQDRPDYLPPPVKLPQPKREPTVAQAEEGDACQIALLDESTGEPKHFFPMRPRGATTIGTTGTNIAFPGDDSLISDRHASVVRRKSNFTLRDEDSTTGTFLRMPVGRKIVIQPGDLVRLGGQFLVFNVEEGVPLMRHYNSSGEESGVHEITESWLIMGREAPLTLDGEDEALSFRHLALRLEGDTVVARDLGSKRGTFRRVLGESVINHGDRFQVGRMHLMFLEREYEPEKTGNPPKGGGQVTIEGHGGPYPVKPGQSLADVAREHNLPFGGCCEGGACGADPVRIISGIDEVDDFISAVETETLRDLCGLTPGHCRLACKLHIHGAVRVRLVD